MQAVLPRPDIAPLLHESYVVLAADADLPEADVHRLVFRLKNASMLPMVLLADAEGSFLGGFSGVTDPARIKELLEKHAGPAPSA